jgi:hypothetical protein
MAEILMQSVSSTQNDPSAKAFSPADTQQVSSTLVSMTRNSDYITTESAVSSPVYAVHKSQGADLAF